MSARLLTLYILPSQGNGEHDNYERVIDTAPHNYCSFVMLPSPSATFDIPDTLWWGLIYGNEWFDMCLKRFLPVHLEQSLFDCLVLFKRVVVNEVERFYTEPRIFRTAKMLPKIKPELNGLHADRVLDGFLLEDKRVIEVSYD